MTAAVETMAYAGEVPWHGLGKRVPADLSTKQMLEAAELDWQVQKRPLVYLNADGDPTQDANFDKQALVRSSDDKILDVVGKGWNPLQNEAAFEFFNEFVNAGDMQMHTAGSLKGGKIVWALAKVNESFEVFGDDKVDSYLLLSNPHIFGQSINVRFTPIRVVCNNTLSLALEQTSKNAIRVSHRAEFDAEAVKETLGIAKLKLDKYKEAAEFLGSKRFTEESYKNFIKEIFPTSSDKKELSMNAEKSMQVLNHQPGHEYAEGTWWQAFNGVTYLCDHVLGRNNDTRLASSWYGANANRKTEALQKAIKYAEAA